jgi:hypothetical protein
MSDLIRRQDAIDAILAVTGNSSVRELYEHVQEHGLSEMWSGGVNAAIDIIIALPSAQTEPCVDTISRQDAIDYCYALINAENPSDPSDEWNYSQERINQTEVILHHLEVMPSAQPEVLACGEGELIAQPEIMKWIPCSERLPEEDTEVLISYRYKEGEGDTDHVNIDITSHGTTCFGGREIHTLKEWRQPFDYFHANYEVIAWMPLPTPYREE